jgi:hypothetical protein
LGVVVWTIISKLVQGNPPSAPSRPQGGGGVHSACLPTCPGCPSYRRKYQTFSFCTQIIHWQCACFLCVACDGFPLAFQLEGSCPATLLAWPKKYPGNSFTLLFCHLCVGGNSSTFLFCPLCVGGQALQWCHSVKWCAAAWGQRFLDPAVLVGLVNFVIVKGAHVNSE